MLINKFQHIIDKVKDAFPQEEWATEIKFRIRADSTVLKALKPEPENENIKIDDFIRATADKICSAHFSPENGSKALISQFVRCKSKLKNIKVCIKTGSVIEKFEKGCILGALVAFKVGNELKLGWSVYNRNHEALPFTKKNAIRVAVIRGLVDNVILKDEMCTTGSEIAIPKEISDVLGNFAIRARKYYAKNVSNYYRAEHST